MATPVACDALDGDDVARSLAPFGQSWMLPAAAYTSAEVYEWEVEHLFDGAWLCVGRSTLVPAAGDQRAITVGRSGVVLTRGSDGVVHAVANICRHRGHELLACGATTNRSTLICPYHAWAFELDGTLKSAPRFGEVANFDPASLGLVQLAAAEWGGWIWVNASMTAPPLLEVLGGLVDICEPYRLRELVPAATHHYRLAANWKLAHENYNECYHCPLIHPELCKVSPPNSGDNVLAADGGYVGGSMQLADHAVTMSIDGTSGASVLPGIVGTALERQVLYFSVLPNLLISMHPDYVMTHRLTPVSATQTDVECQWLFDPSDVARAGFDPSFAADFWDLTNRQDWSAIESVQRSMASANFRPGLLGHAEDSVYSWVTMIANAYAGNERQPNPLPIEYSR
jgi:glycine betaine catabolism A